MQQSKQAPHDAEPQAIGGQVAPQVVPVTLEIQSVQIAVGSALLNQEVAANG